MAESLTQLQEDLMRLVATRRKSNPITGKEIASVIGLRPRSTGKEGADLRSIVHALRCKGYPICASGAGYWWPVDATELNAYLERFEARMYDMSRAIAGMRFGTGKIESTVAVKEADDQKVYYYEVAVEGETRCFQVLGAKLDAFLLKYPDAKKL